MSVNTYLNWHANGGRAYRERREAYLKSRSRLQFVMDLICLAAIAVWLVLAVSVSLWLWASLAYPDTNVPWYLPAALLVMTLFTGVTARLVHIGRLK